ncbi:MAG: M28 family metallopeptidase, partial [Chloroflexi bacterium]|nr:M28 family metallopeptidase [Chloroflexota bacterium]
MTTPATSSSAASLADRALEHIHRLVVEIGPRPAGSAAERQALEGIAAQMEGWGYAVQRLEAPFAPLSIAWTQIAAGALLFAAAWGLPGWPWLAVTLPLLIAALPQLTFYEISRRRRTQRSGNVFACPKDYPAGGAALILCAHVDSARILPRAWMRRVDAHGMALLQRLSFALAALGLLGGLGLRLPPPLHALAFALAGLALAWLALRQLALRRSGEASPGAHDNASGVGALLALAEYYAAGDDAGVGMNGIGPPHPARPCFLFTGAEETG